MLVVRSKTRSDNVPEIGGLELVGLGEGSHGSLQEVTLGSGTALGLGYGILSKNIGSERDTTHCNSPGYQPSEAFAWTRGRQRYRYLGLTNMSVISQAHKAQKAGKHTGRDQSAHNGTALARDLARNGVRLSNVRTPVTPSNGYDRELGRNDGTSDGGSNLLGGLDTETNVAVKVTNGNESLEPGPLTGRSLLLDGHDLHDLVLEGGKEKVDDLELLNGEREEVDLLHGLDLAVLHQSTELGNGDPTCRFSSSIPLVHPSKRRAATDHSLSSSFLPPRRGPLLPRPPAPPRPRPKPPRSAILMYVFWGVSWVKAQTRERLEG